MSKKKEAKPVTDEFIEEAVEDVEVEEVAPTPTPKKVDVDAFIARKLKGVNELQNKAKAKRIRDRLLRNKEVK